MAFEKKISLPSRLREVVVGPQTRVDPAERQHIERILTSLREAAGSLKARQVEYLRAMQQLTMELAIAIASRLLHERIQTGSFPIENIVREIAQRLESKHPMSVHLHPADLMLLKNRGGEELFPSNVELEFVADPTMARGNCRASAGEVTLSANLDEQLDEIRRHLLQTLPSRVA